MELKLTNMEWKYIKGRNKEYSISEYGDVYSHKKNKILSKINSKGYYRTHLCSNSVPKLISNHILVATHFISSKPFPKAEINHIDGNKTNNHYSNLEWVKHSRNLKHAFKLGLRRHQKGESNFGSKLNNKNIAIIRNMISNGQSLAKIGKLFNVTPGTIGHIKYKRTWNNT